MTLKYPIAKMVGNKIRKIRKEYGLTETDLAMYLNISQQQFSRYERGINRIDIDSLVAISFFLKVSIHYFFEDISSEESVKYGNKYNNELSGDSYPLYGGCDNKISFKK